MQVIVKSRCEYNIAVISQVQGIAEDITGDIVQAYTGFNWLLSRYTNNGC